MRSLRKLPTQRGPDMPVLKRHESQRRNRRVLYAVMAAVAVTVGVLHVLQGALS